MKQESTALRILFAALVTLVCILLRISAAHPVPSSNPGSASIRPQTAVAQQPGTWEIKFVVGDMPVLAGGRIEFQLSPFWGWTPPQTGSPNSPGFLTAHSSNPAVSLQVSFPKPYRIALSPANGTLAKGDSVTLLYGDTSGGRYPEARALADRYAEERERVRVFVDPDGSGHSLEVQPPALLNSEAGAPERLAVVAPSLAVVGQSFRVRVAVLDGIDNWCRNYQGPLRFSAQPAGSVSLTPDGALVTEDHGAGEFEAKALRPGLYRIEVADEQGKLTGSSNTVQCLSEPPQYRLFWGDLHGHENYTDGTGTPGQYYEYAQSVAGLDVASLTIHDHHGKYFVDETPELWEEAQAVASAHYRPGNFVTFPGFEWTNWKFGHKHVLFQTSGRLWSAHRPESDTPGKLWSRLRGEVALSIAHHPGGGPMFTDWRYHDPQFQPLVEICSVHGISEYLGGPRQVYDPTPGSFVQDALARGYRLGIIGSGDSHNGHPGRTERLSVAKTGGLAGIYATGLTREEIWDALKRRRVYATTGARIILRFSLNSHFMGEEVPLRPSAPARMDVSAVGCAPIARIDILKNNRVLKTHSGSSLREEFSFFDEGEKRPGDFYYVRVIQTDQETAWSSPIWIESH